MKYLVPVLFLLIVFTACKKDNSGANSSSFSFDLKSQHYSYSGASHTEINTSEYPWTVNIYSWYTKNPIQFYLNIDEETGLYTGIDYYPEYHGVEFNTYYESGNVYYNESDFKVTFTRITNGTMDGTFSGKISGTDNETGATLTDSVANGVFKNVPYETFTE